MGRGGEKRERWGREDGGEQAGESQSQRRRRDYRQKRASMGRHQNKQAQAEREGKKGGGWRVSMMGHRTLVIPTLGI
jgi:hypothetical protein